MILNSGAAFAGVQLAETGFDVRSRRRNRPRAGPAKNKQLSLDCRLFNFVVPMAVEHGRETCVSLACFSLQREAWVVCASYRMSHSMGSCLFVIRPVSYSALETTLRIQNSRTVSGIGPLERLA